MIPYRRSFFFEPVSRRLQESEVFLKLVPSSSLWCFESTMIAAFRTRVLFQTKRSRSEKRNASTEHPLQDGIDPFCKNNDMYN